MDLDPRKVLESQSLEVYIWGAKLGRALGHFIFSLIGLKRILFTSIFSIASKDPPSKSGFSGRNDFNRGFGDTLCYSGIVMYRHYRRQLLLVI